MSRFFAGALFLVALSVATASVSEEQTVYLGQVEAIKRVEVSAQVEGVVTEISFQPGQLVEEGELLLTLEKVEFAQRVRAAEAVAEKARALLQDAKQEYERNRSLKEKGTISQSRYYKSRAAVAITSAALAEAESKLNAAQIELSRTDIYAPISGIISPPLVSRGSYVETGRKGVLARIVQLDPVRIAYEIPYPDRLIELSITDLSTINQYANTVDLTIELAPSWTHPELAKPTFVSSDVNPETRSVTAWAIVRNPTRTLRPGMHVKVRPIAAETTGLSQKAQD